MKHTDLKESLSNTPDWDLSALPRLSGLVWFCFGFTYNSLPNFTNICYLRVWHVLKEVPLISTRLKQVGQQVLVGVMTTSQWWPAHEKGPYSCIFVKTCRLGQNKKENRAPDWNIRWAPDCMADWDKAHAAMEKQCHIFLVGLLGMNSMAHTWLPGDQSRTITLQHYHHLNIFH